MGKKRNLIKLAIIGDFNYTFNAHHATNKSLEYSADFLSVELNYYWIRLHEALQYKYSDFQEFDGVFVAPGPFENDVFLSPILKVILESQLPLFITGTAFKPFVEIVSNLYKLDTSQQKIISEDLFPKGSEQFKEVEVIPHSETLKTLYHDTSRLEFSNAHYSIFPKQLEQLKDVLDVEAYNQFDEPEIVSLSSRPFCVASMSLPQISSTQNSPHPLLNAYLNYLKNSVG